MAGIGDYIHAHAKNFLAFGNKRFSSKNKGKIDQSTADIAKEFRLQAAAKRKEAKTLTTPFQRKQMAKSIKEVLNSEITGDTVLSSTTMKLIEASYKKHLSAHVDLMSASGYVLEDGGTALVNSKVNSLKGNIKKESAEQSNYLTPLLKKLNECLDKVDSFKSLLSKGALSPEELSKRELEIDAAVERAITAVAQILGDDSYIPIKELIGNKKVLAGKSKGEYSEAIQAINEVAAMLSYTPSTNTDLLKAIGESAVAVGLANLCQQGKAELEKVAEDAVKAATTRHSNFIGGGYINAAVLKSMGDDVGAYKINEDLTNGYHLTANPTQGKVDVSITVPLGKNKIEKKINASVKNYKNLSSITVTSGNSLMHLLQTAASADTVNSYFNTAIERVGNKTDDTSAIKSLAKVAISAHEELKYLLALVAIAGNTLQIEGDSGSVSVKPTANIFVAIQNAELGKSAEVYVIDIGELQKKLQPENVSLSDSDNKDSYGVGFGLKNTFSTNKSASYNYIDAFSRIGSLIAQAHAKHMKVKIVRATELIKTLGS